MSGIFDGDSEDLDWSGDLGEYDGERNDLGERHGEGKAVLPNGDVYEGTYFHGKRHGKGVYIFRNGAKYTGYYDQGLKNGDGLLEYPDGSKYEGKWKKNERNGQGVYHYANGDIYDGEWQNNWREGKGVYTCAATQLKYDGHWVNGKLHGPVNMILANHVYLGHFVENRPCGPGRYVFDFGVEQHGKYIFPKKVNPHGEMHVDPHGEMPDREHPVWRCAPDLHPLGS
ncbi:unnamed protein product [Pocillopora meandrina]|uniref:Radial spoke head 1 homolog n=1 Tax=Pocillopora meandrina TaxID=46732 RepID=A0AAU9XHV3_9CNID|nr:unnamed protein product [Pocillopora meandrina]